MPAKIVSGKDSRLVLYSITESLKAWRANATLFSVLVSSSCSASTFWLALRSGYCSNTASRRPSAPPSTPSAWARPRMAAGSPGAAAAVCAALTAAPRALITASSVPRSCAM